jgi:hypothetical protein
MPRCKPAVEAVVRQTKVVLATANLDYDLTNNPAAV